MSNILAIAQKEIRSYFASPIAYVVIGLFALLFGYFYVAILDWFVRQGMMGGMGMQAAPLNLNQQFVRPLLLNATVVLLFVLPMITMRTYAEEKRSGTIELLLTSPVTDLQIILGKFLGAMALYAAMLGVTLVYVGVLFVFGNPEWKPIATAYLGLLLLGRLLHLGGHAHLELHAEPDRRRHADLRRLPAAVGHRLDRHVPRAVGRDDRRTTCRSRGTSRTSPRASSTRRTSSTTSASSPSACS